MPNTLRVSTNLCLTFFGTAAGFPTSVRPKTTSIGLWRGRELYLIDAGDSVASEFALRAIPVDALRAVFITHPHADHIGGLALLIQYLQLNKRTEPLRVYLPEASLEGIRDYLHLLYLWPISEFPLELRPVNEGGVCDEGGVKARAIRSTHLDAGEASRLKAGMRGTAQAFSYIVSIDGKRVYFSGDLGGPEEAAEQAGSVDLAVVELAHFTAEALGAAFSASSLKRLAVTHINDGFEPFESELPDRIRSAGYSGELLLMRNGDEIMV